MSVPIYAIVVCVFFLKKNFRALGAIEFYMIEGERIKKQQAGRKHFWSAKMKEEIPTIDHMLLETES